jgi:hypothetical protein
VAVVDKDQISFDHGHVLLLSVRFRTVVKVFLKQPVHRWGMLGLNFLGNLHLDCKLLVVGSRGSIAKEYQMAIIIGLVVDNVDS